MTLYGLRLLVALLTFAVGVAAAWLFNSGSPKRFERGVVATRSVLVATTTTLEGPPPPPHDACAAFRSAQVVEGGILNGKATSKPQPVYPPAAKAARVSGTVVVQVKVDEDGGVVKAEAVSGPYMLREAAEDAAREARFSPTRLSGQPVRVAGVVTYNFVLN